MNSHSTSGIAATHATAVAASPWHATLIALGAMIATLGFAYAATIASAFHTWLNSDTHRFALLVVPMSLYLVWERRDRLRHLQPSAGNGAMLFALPFGLLWLTADAIDVSLGTQVAVLGMLQVGLLSLLGWRVYRDLLFPLSFLWLLVPAGDFLTPHLMRLTTQLTAGGLSWFGLNVATDGNIVISEAGRIGIVAECSALDFLIGNLVLSLFYAHLVYTKPAKRIVYVAAGLVLAIAANNVRTISVVLISHWSGGDWDLLSDHRLYGWSIFLLFVVAQMLAGARFKDPHLASPGHPSAPTCGPPGSRRRTYLVMSGLIVLLVLPPASLLLARAGTPDPALGSLHGPAWLRHTPQPADGWHPVFKGAQAEFIASHPVDDQMIDFYVAYYWQQHDEAELIGWPNAVYDGEHWHRLADDPQTATVDGRQMPISESRLRGPQRARRLTWHWYWVDRQFTASPIVAKLLQAKATLLGGDTRGAVVVVSTREQPDSQVSRRAMQRFIDQASFLTTMLTTAGSTPGDVSVRDPRP